MANIFIKGNNKKSETVLLWVHGSGCNKEFLLPLAKKITEYDNLVIDLPGHGDDSSTVYEFKAYVNSVIENAKQYKKVVIIGHSLGGTIILSALSQNIPNIIGGIGISTGAKFYKGIDKKIMDKVHNNEIDVNYLALVCGHTDNPDVLETLSTMDPPKSMIEDFKIDEVVDVEDGLKNIKKPVLMMTGLDDILVSPEYSDRAKMLIGENCKINRYPGFMHMLPIANMNQICEDIVTFVKSLE